MSAAPDPVSAARSEIRTPSLAEVARFVTAWDVVRDADGEPEVLEVVVAPEAIGQRSMVWFRADRARLHLVVETSACAGGFAATFAHSAPYARVALRIRSRGIEPDAITAMLGMAPSRQARAGRPLLGDGAVDRPEHLWVRDVLPGSAAAVEHKLQHLLDALEPRRFGLADVLRGSNDATITVAYHADADAMDGFALDAGLLGRIAGLRIPLEFDLYAERPGGPPH